jgi:hypothetical protein
MREESTREQYLTPIELRALRSRSCDERWHFKSEDVESVPEYG